MLACRSQVEAAIDCYVRELIAQGIDVDRVYLFGSQTNGRAHEWSDVDVIIVSNDFANVPLWKRPEITGAARGAAFAETGESVVGLAKTPDEVATCHTASFLADVLKDAVVVYDRSAVRAGAAT